MQPVPQSPQSKRQGGYTIVELSIALTIIGILIVAGLAGVNSLLTSSKANSQIEDSGRALAKLQAFVSSTVSSPGLTTDSAIGLGLFPSSRVSGTAGSQTVANVFAGAETVATNAAAIGTIAVNTGAIYTLTNIPKAICSDIATSLAPLSDSVRISNGTTPTADVFTAGTAVKSSGSLNLASVGTACNQASLLHLQFALKP